MDPALIEAYLAGFSPLMYMPYSDEDTMATDSDLGNIDLVNINPHPIDNVQMEDYLEADVPEAPAGEPAVEPDIVDLDVSEAFPTDEEDDLEGLEGPSVSNAGAASHQLMNAVHQPHCPANYIEDDSDDSDVEIVFVSEGIANRQALRNGCICSVQPCPAFVEKSDEEMPSEESSEEDSDEEEADNENSDDNDERIHDMVENDAEPSNVERDFGRSEGEQYDYSDNTQPELIVDRAAEGDGAPTWSMLAPTSGAGTMATGLMPTSQPGTCQIEDDGEPEEEMCRCKIKEIVATVHANCKEDWSDHLPLLNLPNQYDKLRQFLGCPITIELEILTKCRKCWDRLQTPLLGCTHNDERFGCTPTAVLCPLCDSVIGDIRKVPAESAVNYDLYACERCNKKFIQPRRGEYTIRCSYMCDSAECNSFEPPTRKTRFMVGRLEILSPWLKIW